MARHYDRRGDSITYYWRWTRVQTPSWLDLHPAINWLAGPRWLVWLGRMLYTHGVRHRCHWVDEG